MRHRTILHVRLNGLPTARAEVQFQHALDLMSTFTPQVLPVEREEAFLDVTACLRLFGGREALMGKLRGGLRTEAGVTPTLGIGENMLVAKIATLLGAPGETREVAGDPLEDVLAPLPVSLLWRVEADARRRLAHMGVGTFGQLRRIPSALLVRQFGEAGRVMFDAARGVDDRVVPVYELGDPALAVRCLLELPRPTRDAGALRGAALDLAGRLARGLRARGRSARRLEIGATFNDRRRRRRARALSCATDSEADIAAHARAMIGSLVGGARPCIAIELAALDLTDARAARQLSLFEPRPLREQALGAATDALGARMPGVPVMPALLEGTPARSASI